MSTVVPSQISTSSNPSQPWSKQMFLRTAWRHWRSTRALWLIMILPCVGLQWITGMHAVVRSDTSVDLITQGICMLFAMATPALAFSFDVETRTQPRTLMLPGSWSQVIAAITLCVLLQTLVLLLIGVSNAALVEWSEEFQKAGTAYRSWTEILSESNTLSRLAVATPLLVIAMATGFVSAFLCRSTLAALITSGCILFCILALAVRLESTGPDFFRRFGLAIPILAGIAWVAGSRWFRPGFEFALPKLRISIDRPERPVKCPRRLRAVLSTPVSQPQRDRRAITWRESSASWALFALFGMGLLLVPKARFLGAIEASLIASFACGMLAFRSEHLRDRIRFLSERGLSGSTVWLGKHRVWLPRAILIAAILYFQMPIVNAFRSALGLWLGVNSEWSTPPLWQIGNWFLSVLAAYAIGQACSIWFRRFILGLVTGAGISTIVALWTAFASQLEIPAAIALVPMTLALMYASWRWCDAWLRQRTGVPNAIKSTATILTGCATVWLLSAGYRIFEIPSRYGDVEIGNNWSLDTEVPRALRDRSALFGRTEPGTQDYLNYAAQIRDLPTIYPVDVAPKAWDQLDGHTQAWVLRHNEMIARISGSIKKGVELTNLDETQFKQLLISTPTTQFNQSETPRGQLIHGRHYLPLMLLELEGARLQAIGEYASAIDLYAMAIHGYWQTVRSTAPGRDLLSAYAGAGHIFRRMGELACEWTATANPVDDIRSRISKLHYERPTLEEVNAWVSKSRAKPQRTGFYVYGNPTAGRRYVMSSGINTAFEPYDILTFGARRARILNWFRQGRHAMVYSSNQGTPLAKTLTSLNAVWSSNVDAIRWSLDGQFATTDNPTAWVASEANLQSDVSAALTLAAIGRIVGQIKDLPYDDALEYDLYQRTQLPASASFIVLPEDPWAEAGGNQRARRMQWRRSGISASEHQNHDWPDAPRVTPMLISVGAPEPAPQYSRTDWLSAGGPRFYPVPKKALAELKSSAGE